MSAIANTERLTAIILGPHISEKSTAVAEGASQVVFRVKRDATKSEIKRAVELLFEVKVDAVSVVSMPGKRRRFGMRVGRQSAWKKAYVKLAPGQNLDFIGAE
ncbi:MAG TPA: 50S ribosomal protein L23 [Gammaproteobacteria bacterium]|nr:50S ribosomal protein L23 [Gammaproteobacteria bacterium]